MADWIRLRGMAAFCMWMCLSCSVGTAAAGGPVRDAESGSSAPADAVLAYVNDFRAQEGLPALTADSSLLNAAQNHSNYMSADLSYFDHEETHANSPYFTGVSPRDRVTAAGYGKFSSLYENLELGTPCLDGVAQLFASPYHRYAFLDPGNTQFGAGLSTLAPTDQYASAPILTMEFAAPVAVSAAPVVSPAAGQQDVPVSWTDYESPDPLRFYNLPSNSTVGYPIVVFVAPPAPDQLLAGYHIDEMQLFDSSGQKIPGYLNTMESGDAETVDGPVLIPKSPLHFAATYSVSVRGSLTVKTQNKEIHQIPFFRKWSFSTAAKDKQDPGNHLVVDGRWVHLDQPMELLNGRTSIPLATIAGSLGLGLVWNPAAQTAYVFRGQQLLILQPGESAWISGGESQSVDMAFDPSDQRLLVPLRRFAQLFGDSVGWDELTHTVFVYTNDSSR